MPATKFDYQRYLASREWALLREQVKERCYGSCERCSGDNAAMKAVHHLTYERTGHERLEDLLGVCGECHSFLSAKSDVDPLDINIQGAIAEVFRCQEQLAQCRAAQDHVEDALDVLSCALEQLSWRIAYRTVALQKLPVDFNLIDERLPEQQWLGDH